MTHSLPFFLTLFKRHLISGNFLVTGYKVTPPALNWYHHDLFFCIVLIISHIMYLFVNLFVVYLLPHGKYMSHEGSVNEHINVIKYPCNRDWCFLHLKDYQSHQNSLLKIKISRLFCLGHCSVQIADKTMFAV